jgi:hypothetical protein
MNDNDVIAKRGHLVVLRRTLPRQFYFLSGGCANGRVMYVFCRHNRYCCRRNCCREEEIPQLLRSKIGPPSSESFAMRGRRSRTALQTASPPS